MINVVNKYKHIPTDHDLYIGRGSSVGNPYTSRPLGTTKAEFQADSVEDSLEKYEQYIKGEVIRSNKDITDFLNTLVEIENMGGEVNLVCFCAPKPCHGDVIKKLIAAKRIIGRFEQR